MKRNFASKKGCKTTSNFWDAEFRVKISNRKIPIGYEGGMKNRAE